MALIDQGAFRQSSILLALTYWSIISENTLTSATLQLFFSAEDQIMTRSQEHALIALIVQARNLAI
jgi:hypothetical protein